MINDKCGMFMICQHYIIITVILTRVAKMISKCNTCRTNIFLVFEIIMICYFFIFYFLFFDFAC